MIRYIRPIIYDDDDNDLTSNDRYTRYSHLNDTIVHDFLFSITAKLQFKLNFVRFIRFGAITAEIYVNAFLEMLLRMIFH